jgi:hypothetical protein
MKKDIKLLLIVIVIIVASLACVLYPSNVYTLRDDNGGQIIWKSDEAYLFMAVVRRGYRSNLFAYAWSAFEESFNAVHAPNDQRVFLTVIHARPSGIERNVVRLGNDTASIPDFLTPIGELIYANCQGTLCKLSGDHFESASSEETQKFGGIDKLSSDSDTESHGWRKQGIGQVAGDAESSIHIGGDLILKVRQGNVYKSATSGAIVELQRAAQPTQELWRVNGEPRRVSKREYDQALSTLTN